MMGTGDLDSQRRLYGRTKKDTSFGSHDGKSTVIGDIVSGRWTICFRYLEPWGCRASNGFLSFILLDYAITFLTPKFSGIFGALLVNRDVSPTRVVNRVFLGVTPQAPLAREHQCQLGTTCHRRRRLDRIHPSHESS
jgi:hypothetical protein